MTKISRPSSWLQRESHRLQQSPIELFETRSLRVNDATLHVERLPERVAGVFREDNQHHPRFALTARRAQRPRITFRGMTAYLDEVHLHRPSEHDLEGDDASGEIHLVHRFDEPRHGGSSHLVLGVLFDARHASTRQRLSPKFCRTWGKAFAPRAKRVPSASPPTLALRDLLPRDERWFHYEGSLTTGDTEPYAEVVSWIVFATPLRVDARDLKHLGEATHQRERKGQALNRRLVVRNF
ncbi:MAG: carbonic anhydrase family protein [Labilithrix sp.]|nr:carbonic anhydrase family protein [Labilithrix sp.]MBX3215486.1 carbonic anhydrase family protein [Labilithrix sp.]